MVSVPFRVHISDPQLVGELRERMADADCLVRDVTERGFVVVHRHAETAAEARRELSFFLRAWQARYPSVAVELT
jgi:hypothetical protein